MKEREFESWIMDVAARFGWRCWHVPMPMRHVGAGKMVPESRAAGLPDLILMHTDPPRLIFAEVKAEAPLSDSQKEFLRLARGVVREIEEKGDARVCPVGAYTWRPGGEETIESILRSRVLL